MTTKFVRRAPPVVLCALVAHAAVYRSVWPAGGAHGYLIWYAPLVAALSVLAIVALPLLFALAAAGRRESPAFKAIAAVFVRAPERDPVAGALALASEALVFLFVQESLERSLVLHRAAVASFAPPTWMVLLATALVAAGLVAWLGRTVSMLVEAILDRPRVFGPHPAGGRRAPQTAWVARRTHPLAVHGGLRAPPVGA